MVLSSQYKIKTTLLLPYQSYRSELQICSSIKFNNMLADIYFSGILSMSNNINITGILKPNNKNNNISLYYSYAMNYIPEMQFHNIIKTSYNFGIHNNRFDNDNNGRWYSSSIVSLLLYKKQSLRFIWSYIFNNWNQQVIKIEYEIDLYNNIEFNIGLINWLDNSTYIYQPTLTLLFRL